MSARLSEFQKCLFCRDFCFSTGMGLPHPKFADIDIDGVGHSWAISQEAYFTGEAKNFVINLIKDYFKSNFMSIFHAFPNVGIFASFFEMIVFDPALQHNQKLNLIKYWHAPDTINIIHP